MASITTRELIAGPGGRGAIELRSRDIAAEPAPGRALIRNLITLIYPGYDLGLIDQAERDGVTRIMGRLAIGRVEKTTDHAARAGLEPSRFLMWSGPHADWAELDPERHAWAAVNVPEPSFLVAGIGVEAESCLDLALGAGWAEAAPGRAVVIGQGMLGHLAGQVLRLRGWHVVVVENSPKRLEFSKYQGLTRRIDTHNLDWSARLDRALDGEADLIVEASGNPLPLAEILKRARPEGTLALAGTWRPALDMNRQPDEVRAGVESRGIKLTGPPRTFGEAADHSEKLRTWIDRIREKNIPVERLFTTRSPADLGSLEMKRLATGVKSMLGVELVWEA